MPPVVLYKGTILFPPFAGVHLNQQLPRQINWQQQRLQDVNLHVPGLPCAVPDDACTSYRILYKMFQEFENDLHQHIHLENNILFPGAIALEKTWKK